MVTRCPQLRLLSAVLILFSLLLPVCSPVNNPYTDVRNLSAELSITNSDAMREMGDTIVIQLHVNVASLVDSAEITWGDSAKTLVQRIAFGDTGVLCVSHLYAAPGTYSISAILYTIDGTKKTLVPEEIVIKGLAPFISPIADTIRTVATGGSISFSFYITGTQPLAYTWKHGQDSIAATQQYAISNVTPSDSGPYFCIVKNPWGADTSRIISLRVPLDTSASIASLAVMSIRDTNELWSSSIISGNGKVTCATVIRNDTAFLQIVTTEHVYSVKIDGAPVTANADTNGRIFENKRLYLPVAGNNEFIIEVVSEDRKTARACTLAVPSALRPAIDPVVQAPDSGTYRSLIPQCSIDGDSRVSSIIILRAEHAMPSIALSADTLPVEGATLPGDSTIFVAKILPATGGPAGIDDSLKPNTTYYYRFITCGGMSGSFFYGAGLEASRATTGKISISATATVTASYVSDGASDYDWEMFGTIAFCSTVLWSTPASSYTVVNEGGTTGPLGTAAAVICAPGGTNCTVSFVLADYDASSANDGIGLLLETVIVYDQIATITPKAGIYTFTSSKSYPFSGESGTGAVNYIFSCKYVD